METRVVLIDAILYVKLEAFAAERGIEPETALEIFLESWVGLTRDRDSVPIKVA